MAHDDSAPAETSAPGPAPAAISRPPWRTGPGCVGLSTLIAAFFVLWGLHRAPLHPWDEAWYGTVVLRMVHSGDWWVYAEPGSIDAVILKPPLCLWVMAGAVSVLGPTELALRLPSALCYIGLVAAVTAFSYRRWNARVALLAGFLLSTDRSLLANHCARSGDMDAPLMLFLTLTAISAWQIGRRRAAWWGAAAFAGALLSKGAAALQIVPALYVWLAGSRAWRGLLRLTGLLVLATVPLLLWLGVRESMQPGFARRMLGVDVYGRLSTQIDGQAPQNPARYLWNFGRSAGPVILGLVVLAAALRGRFQPKSQIADPAQARPLAFLLVLWWAVPFALFMLARTSRSWYTYPTYVPAYLLGAWLLAAGLSRLRRERRRKLSALVLVVVLGGMGGPAAWKVLHHSRSSRARVVELERLIGAARRAAPDEPVVTYWPDPRVRFYLARADVAHTLVLSTSGLTEQLGAGSKRSLLLFPVDRRDEVAAALPGTELTEVMDLPRIGFVVAECGQTPRQPDAAAPTNLNPEP